MFYLLLRLLWEDKEDGYLDEKQYIKGIQRLAEIHDKYYDTWQLTYMKYAFPKEYSDKDLVEALI